MRINVSQRKGESVRGRLTEWNDDRGFGFVTSLDDQSRAFVHISEFPRELRRPCALDLLTYRTRVDERGRLQAFDVSFLAPVAARKPIAHPSRPAGWAPREVPVWVPFVPLAVLLLVGSVVLGYLAAWFVVGYLVMSFVTYGAYARDKDAAVHGGFRTQEAALHLLDVIGGWPGALIAQRRLRHKTTKQSYQAVFWVTVFLNLAALALFVGAW